MVIFMRKFSILILILIATGVVGTTIFLETVGTDRTFVTEDRTEQKVIQAILEVPSVSYEVFVPEASNAYDLMAATATQYEDFSFNGRDFTGIGFFVETINGLSQDRGEGMYWIYYINGKVAPVGISQYKLKADDVITWKYEKEH